MPRQSEIKLPKKSRKKRLEPSSLVQDSQSRETSPIFNRSLGLEAVTQDMIRQCQDDNQKAWNSFYLHLTPVIGHLITYKVFALCPSKLAVKLIHHDKVVEDIFCKVFEKITTQGYLKSFNPENSLNAWLETVVNSQTADWLRANRQRRREASQVEGERLTIPFQIRSAEGSNKEQGLHDCVKDPDAVDQEEDFDIIYKSRKQPKPLDLGGELQSHLTPHFSDPAWEELRQQLTSFNLEQLWLLRLKLMYTDQLDFPGEIEALAAYSEHDFYLLSQKIAAVIQRLDRKLEENNHSKNTAGLLGTQIRTWQYELKNSGGKKPLTPEKRLELENNIAVKQQNMEKHQHLARRLLHPTTSEIAELMGAIKATDSESEQRRTISRLNTGYNRIKSRLWPDMV